MTEWWQRPSPGEGFEFVIDPDTGVGGWRYHEHLWLAPLRGLGELVSDIRHGRMRTRNWAFLLFILIAIGRGTGG
jgi:hypothetical protein